ncbi:Ribosomal protein S18 acetylase RimI [Sphingomonas gellani]|uniref:Ribosomal protein S18 acetylase RimI n=1 Tax=Sphingomonas gellani TaxID=1166340 RepID=A0A1H8J790_9SPHN|nr:GNAT family N-acetyltransferase [Sphingomonas gellani]SEN76529.1 Ribosomal protein S18 acetylase RimI [Sphingomonas gellani]
MSTVNYRPATARDASLLGALHVTSWHETYSGLLPQDMLDGLSAESRTAMWATVLDAPTNSNGTRVYVAEGAAGIVGFGACGGQRDDVMRESGFTGEIGAIYILRSQQGAGVGRALMSLIARDLVERPIPSASLWVLRENVRARGFYDGLGGAIITEKEVAEGDTTLHEVAYGWPDLAHLI